MADQFIGEIRMFSGDFAPRYWLLCNGAILPISQYASLYSLLGVNYGGDGRTSFGIPDFRGRVPLHMGQGMGLSNRTIGSRGGMEFAPLTAQQIPIHNHTLMGVNSDATKNEPQGNSFAKTEENYLFYSDAVSDQLNPLAAQTIGAAGGNNRHLNMMPYTVMNFIIAIDGLYPSRT